MKTLAMMLALSAGLALAACGSTAEKTGDTNAGKSNGSAMMKSQAKYANVVLVKFHKDM